MNQKQFAIKIAKQAGKIIVSNFSMGMKKNWKADSSPVTKTDIAVNKMVIQEAKKYFPTHGVLGEEQSYAVEGKEYLWVCDPVDGTVPFSHGFPTFCFSLALVKDGVPILGVVYDPMMKRMLVAEKGKGAYLNNKKIKVNKLDLSRGVSGWTNLGMTELRTKYPNLCCICFWCICYEGMLVAAGEIQASYYNHHGAHDIAALKVIIEEAGGKVTDRNGNEQRYDRKINGALLSNGVVHKELLEFIKNNKL